MSANAAVSRNANPYLKRLIDDSQSEVITLARGHGQFVLDEQQWLDIPLETGVTVRARKLHYTIESGMGVWVGEVQSDDLRQRRGQPTVDLSREVAVDPQNLAVLVRNGERITGTVSVGGRQYQIEPVDKGQVAVTRMKLADTPLDDSPASYGTAEKRATGTGERNTQQPIRVLTVYSNDAKLAVADPVALGISHFAYFKEVARASGVTGIYENAGVVNIDYNQPTKNCLGDLPCMNALLSPIGRLSSDMRTQVKAQLVIALLQTDGGLASTAGPVSLDRAQAYASMFDSRTYAHELGHLLGAHHEDAGVPLPYSRGYCQRSIEPYWRTIMGYCGSGNKSIDFYSTPLRTYNGLPMGVADVSDNVRAINEWNSIIAGFFPPVDPLGAPIASGFVELGQKELPFSAESAILNGAASRNPGSDAMRYEWTQTAGVPAVTIDNSQSMKATANFSEVSVPTDYRFRLTVANATGHVDATEVGVRVYPRDIGAACDNVAAWDPEQTYSIAGEQVSYQGSLYRLLTQPSGNFTRRPPAVWSGLSAPMNWALVKACNAPRTLEQRLATVDAWALTNGATPVTSGLQEQLRNLLVQQQFTWPPAEAAGRMRPIAFESKNCVVRDPANAGRLVLQEACNEERAGRWLLDGSGRLHSMDDPGLCLINNGNNQRVTLTPCTDASTPWIRLKDNVSDYQMVSGQSLLSNFTLNMTSANYGDFLADDGNQNLIVKTRTQSNSIRYATFGNIPQDSSLLLAHAKAQTLTAIGRVLDGQGVPGTAPPMPPQIIVSGPTTAEALEPVLLDASQSSSINPGASDLQYTWQAPPGISAQTDGAQLRFTAPTVTSATPFVFNLAVSDGLVQAQEQHTVTVARQGHSDPEGELSLPAEVLEKNTVTFTANVHSPGGLPLTYVWQRPIGFTGTVGNTPSVTLTAPAVAADTPVVVEVTVTDSEGGSLTLRGTVLVKKDTQMTGGRIDGPAEVNSEESVTLQAYVNNPQNRPLTYVWTVTSPATGQFEIVGPSDQRDILIKAPRITDPTKYNVGQVRVLVRDGVSFASIPNRALKINALELPPLIGRLIMPSMVNVGDVFVPRVVLDNADGREISYTWWVNDDYFELLSSDPKQPTAQIKATRSSNNAGLVIEARVSDGTGRITRYNTPRVVVYEPKGTNPPQGQVEGPLEVASGQPVSYRAVFSSPVGNPLSYAWVKGSLIGATPNSAEQTWTAPVVTTDQVITVRVTVTDNAGNANSHAIAVVVKAPGDNPPPQPPVGRIISDDTLESGAQVPFSTDAMSTVTGSAKPWGRLQPCSS
ncbi:hypothetical protein BOO88_20605 [Stutzerimonas stutzeri]|nr:hypothetical protein BOO88_20605 [Stutzerimonas stutzeri]